MKRSYLFLALAACTLTAAFGQQSKERAARQSESQNEEVVRISVRLVQIDGTVTDKDGRAVTDLKKEDFELLVDGRRQQITNFSYVDAQPGSTPAPQSRRRTDRELPPPPAPPVRLRVDQVHRTIALVIGNISAESLHDVKKALQKFVDELMQPGDLVAIVRLGEGMGVLQQFTSDKRLLRLAINGVRWNPLGGARLNAIPSPRPVPTDIDPELTKAKTDAEDFYQDLVGSSWLQRLNLIVRGIQPLPGRKSVILFSDGFQLFGDNLDDHRTLEELQRLTDRATRALVVFYTIDARGLQTLNFTPLDSVNVERHDQVGTPIKSTTVMNGPTYAAARQQRVERFLRSQDGLALLAGQTGGLFMQSTDLGRAISRTLNDQKSYYLIGYRPDEKDFKPEAGGRPYHKIEVKVKRTGLTARFRKGFYGTPDREPVPAPGATEQKLFAALTSPFDASDVGLRLTSLFGHDKQDGSFIRSLLHIDVNQLTFTEEADRRHKAVINLFAATFNENGLVAEPVTQRYTIRVRDERLEQVKREGLTYEMLIPVRKAGIIQVRTAVEDAESERVGSASQFIEVPDLEQNRLTLSSIVISGSGPSPENKPAASPQDAGDVAGQPAPGNLEANTAVRRFRQGMRLDYALIVYNAQLARESQRPELDTQVALYHDGKLVYQGPVQLLDPGPQADLKQIVTRGSLELGSTYLAGEYVLQIIVTDKLAKESKYRRETRWVDFDVVE